MNTFPSHSPSQIVKVLPVFVLSSTFLQLFPLSSPIFLYNFFSSFILRKQFFSTSSRSLANFTLMNTFPSISLLKCQSPSSFPSSYLPFPLTHSSFSSRHRIANFLFFHLPQSMSLYLLSFSRNLHFSLPRCGFIEWTPTVCSTGTCKS